MAYVTSPDGTPGEVPDEQLSAAVEQGFKPRQASAEEAARTVAGGQKGQTFGEGLARGLSFGLGDELVSNLETEFGGNAPTDPAELLNARANTTEMMRTRREVNPGSGVVGELAGALAPSLATGGGVSALAGGGLKGSMVEGGLFGLGSAVSESTLNRDPLTLEKMAAGVAGGALTAGVLHGALTGVKKGFSFGLKKLGGGTFSDTLTEMADSAERKTLFASQSGKLEKNEGLMDEIIQLRRDLNIGSIGRDGADVAAAHSNDIGGKIGQSIDDLERQIPLKGNDKLRGELISAVEDSLEPLSKNQNYRESLASIRKDLAGYAADPDVTWKDIWDYQHGLWEQSKNGTGLSKDVIKATKEAIRTHVFDTVAEGIQNGSGAALRKQGRSYAVAKALEEALDKQATRFESSTGPVGNKVLRIASLAHGGLPGLGMELGGEFVQNQMSKRGGFLASSVLRKLADSGALDAAATGIGQRATVLLQTARPLLGAAANSLEQAVARGGIALVEEHARLASGPDGQQYMALMGMSPESPEEVEAVGGRLAAMQALKGAQGEIDAAISKGVDRALGTAKGRTPRFVTPSNKDFEKHAAAINALVKDPESVYGSIPSEISGAAPATSAELTANLMKAASFLDSKAPKNPYDGIPKAMQPHWQPSRSDVDRWYKYVEAVENPTVVLDKLAQGMFSMEHKEAVQAVYPQLYEDMKAQVFEKLSTWDKPIPYQKKMMMAQMFGTSILGLKPGAAMVLQKSFQPSASEGMPSKGGSRPDARQAIDSDRPSDATKGQELEE